MAFPRSGSSLSKNEPVRTCPGQRLTATRLGAAIILTFLVLAGCGQSHTASASASETPSFEETADPQARLAARAAAAKDLHFVAEYSLTTSSSDNDRDIVVTIAEDGTWRVDIQDGALGGTTDVAFIGLADGQYQCGLSTTTDQGCVKVASATGTIPSSLDPTVQYPFTTWLDVLTNQTVAVTVAVTTPLQNASGTCFSVEPTTVTLAPPIGSSVICFDDDGTMTGVKGTFGTMIVSGTPQTAPATVSLPGKIVSRSALPTTTPTATPTATASSSASAKTSPTR